MPAQNLVYRSASFIIQLCQRRGHILGPATQAGYDAGQHIKFYSRQEGNAVIEFSILSTLGFTKNVAFPKKSSA